MSKVPFFKCSNQLFLQIYWFEIAQSVRKVSQVPGLEATLFLHTTYTYLLKMSLDKSGEKVSSTTKILHGVNRKTIIRRA